MKKLIPALLLALLVAGTLTPTACENTAATDESED